jgi:hypothetical protein
MFDTMKELDIDALLGAMEKPTTGKNLNSLMEALGKANEMLTQVESLMTKFDKMGLKPLLVRGLGAKLGIDAESPLKSEQAIKSPTHAKFIDALNLMSEDELKGQMEALERANKGKKA